MKRILVSQRRDKVVGRDETRDALDVRWAKILFDLGFLPIPVCSELANEVGYIEALKPNGILLSGGNDIGEAINRDCLEHSLLDYAKQNKLPVLGVCRGMQMINHYCGGGLESIENHVAIRHEVYGAWVQKMGLETVNSYHNQGITSTTLASSLKRLAESDDGVIEAIEHNTLPWLGIMWHPEREILTSEADKNIISNLFGRKEYEFSTTKL